MEFQTARFTPFSFRRSQIEGIARQGAAKAPIILLQQGTQDRAAQRPPAAQLKLLLLPGGGVTGPWLAPAPEGLLHKTGFQAAGPQKALDLFEASAQSQVIHIAHDGGQDRAQVGGKRNHQAGHDSRLYSIIDICQKNRYLTQKNGSHLSVAGSGHALARTKTPALCELPAGLGRGHRVGAG